MGRHGPHDHAQRPAIADATPADASIDRKARGDMVEASAKPNT